MLNVVYVHMTEEMDATTRKEFDRALAMPFDHELTPAERAREERRRKALEIGAIHGQQEALGAMRMQTGR